MEQHPLPALATVAAAVDATLIVGAKHVPERRHEYDIGVSRMDNDRANVARVAQTDMLPSLAGVERFVDTVAVCEVAARTGLAGAHIDDIVIGVGDCDGANGCDLLLVEHRLPGDTGIGALPYTAGQAAEIPRRMVALYPAHRDDSPAPERFDQTPLHATEQISIHLTGGRCGVQRERKEPKRARERAKP